MKEIKKPKWGILPPLFDRIRQRDDGTSYHDLLTEEGLRESIQKELSIMMESRVSVRQVEYDEEKASIPVYGAPDYLGLVDFSYFDAQDPTQWDDIASYLQTAIEAIEPRLKNVRVKVLRFDGGYQELYLEVSGTTNIDRLNQEITFPVALDSSRSRKSA